MFEFWDTNILNTTTMLITNTSTIRNYLFDEKKNTQWYPQVFPYTSVTVGIVLNETQTTLDGIFILNHNLNGIKIFFNSDITTFLSFGASYILSNTYIYLSNSFTNIKTIDFGFKNNADTVVVGEIIISKSRKIRFNSPDYTNYNPIIKSIGIQRKMIDGGIINIRNSSKFYCDMYLSKINTSTYSSLTAIWNENKDFLFIPYNDYNSTTYSFNGQIEHVRWVNDFEFNFFNNNTENGYQGRIILNQIEDQNL